MNELEAFYNIQQKQNSNYNLTKFEKEVQDIICY